MLIEFLGGWNDTTSSGKGLVDSYKTKHTPSTLWLSKASPRYFFEENENISSQKDLY